MQMTTELTEYTKALRAGQREYKSCVAAGLSGYVEVLDDILPPAAQSAQKRIGLVDIPMELIVGTKTAGRQYALSASFLPLLDADTEFGLKWLKLCQVHLSAGGIESPIDCFEYYGKFYVQEGNKRVSVLRWFGAARISGNVVRIMPTDTDSERYAIYREFLDFHKITGLYQVQFTRPGGYAKLMAALGYDGTPWTQEQRRSFSALYTRFTGALRGQVFLGTLTPADALLVFLRYHPFSDLQELDASTLKKEIALLQKDIRALDNPEPVAVSTTPADVSKEPSLTRRIFGGRMQPRIAFIHERSSETSTWTYAHEQGRAHLQEVFGPQIETRAYYNAVPGVNAEALIEQAAADGANVIFTTTPSLIGDTTRCALRMRGVRLLNCSVDMPYPDVRTYYTRVYESKFVTGVIAGAMARNGQIGYVADYPIYGVPASINAFALGARTVNPDARVSLEWSCVRRDYLDAFRSRGITIVSNRDVPAGEQPFLEYGTFLLRENNSMQPLGSPVWNWGRLYEQIIRSMMDGTWDDGPSGGQAVSYWWGMQAGVIDVLISDQLPEGVRFLAGHVRRLLQTGQLDPFGYTWTAQDGTVFSSDRTLTPQQILHMNVLCDNVDGTIPAFDELLPMAQHVTRILGVCKDKLPPEVEVLPS